MINESFYLQLTNGKTIPIPTGEAIMGRQPDNPIVIDEQGVSRQHAKLLRQGNQVTLTDLNSSNGTYVNGQKLTPHITITLTHRDEIRLGQQLQFTFYGDAASYSIEKTTLEPIVMPQGYLAVNPPPAQIPNYPPPYQQPTANNPDPNIAVVLEILGVIGIMGIGRIYSGQTGLGIAMLISWFIFVWGSYLIILLGASFFTAITFGLGFLSYCCLCIIPMMQIAVPIASALQLKSDLQKRR